MRTPPSLPSDKEADLQARLDGSKRMMNYLLLGLGAMVLGTIGLGIFKMVSLVIQNS